MTDQLLSQSEIDALLQSIPPKAEAPSGAQEKSAPEATAQETRRPSVVAASPEPVVKTISLQDIAARESSQVPEVSPESVSSLNATILDLSQRLSKVEAMAQRLERLERETAGAGVAQVTPQQLQSVMQSVQNLGVEVKNISTKLQGTLGYDIYHSFKCNSCGSQGQLATVFKCTKCGDQSWRGWWPKKK